MLGGLDTKRLGLESEKVEPGQELGYIIRLPSFQEACVRDHGLLLMLHTDALYPLQPAALPFGFQETHPLTN